MPCAVDAQDLRAESCRSFGDELKKWEDEGLGSASRAPDRPLPAAPLLRAGAAPPLRLPCAPVPAGRIAKQGLPARDFLVPLILLLLLFFRHIVNPTECCYFCLKLITVRKKSLFLDS